MDVSKLQEKKAALEEDLCARRRTSTTWKANTCRRAHPSCYFPQALAGLMVVCPRPAGDAEGREHPARVGGLSWQASVVGCDPTHQPLPRGRPHVLSVLSDVRAECDLHWQGHSRRRWGCRGRQGKKSPQEGT